MRLLKTRQNEKNVELGNYYIDDIKNATVIKNETRKAVICGQLYRVNGQAIEDINSDSVKADLAAQLVNGEQTLLNAIEGIFIIAIYDSVLPDSVRLYQSHVINHDLFYAQHNEVCASTSLCDFGNHGRIDNKALTCILLEGYCPSKHTRYLSVRRLGIAQYLEITAERVKCIDFTATAICISPEPKLTDYYRKFENAILSRRSPIQNWVELSGGWDSTSTLATLHKFGSKNLQAVTTALILSDGTHFNEYEVKKSSDIADYYSIPHLIVNYDLRDESLLDYFYSNVTTMKDHGIFESCALWRPVMYDQVYRRATVGATCFNSLFSDSVHNFGFSQYVTMPDNDYVYREFADKMISYLWGPTFFEKVENGSYTDDSIYTLFRRYLKVPEDDLGAVASSIERKRAYFLSFLYGDYARKVPLASPCVYSLLSTQGLVDFKYFMREGYIDQACEQVNTDNFYAVVLNLYKNFYLQGGEQKLPLYLSTKQPVSHATPFLDSDLIAFLEAMPESWGRGVNSQKSTKYPLKEYAANEVDFPFAIMRKYKYHAYVSESETGCNTNYTYELLNNSIYAKAIFSKLNQRDVEQHFDSDHFNIPALTSLLLDKTSSTPIRKRLLIYLAAITAQ